MTTVRLFHAAGSGCITGYAISGHAGYAAHGKDIVCAALSFLSITCANALESVAGQTPQTAMDDETGYLSVRLQTPNEKAQVIFQVLASGVRDLCNAYPKHIQIVD